MSRLPRVTVIVPLYQKAATVSRTVGSILSQRFEDFELIVVDDGSVDDGPRIVAEFDDPRVSLIRQNNAGPGAARNRGIRAARGTYVAFLDADDTWRSDYLERMVAALDAAPEAAAASCAFATDQGSLVPLWRRRGLRDGTVAVDPGTRPAFVVALVAFLSPCTTMIRRDAALRLGGFYERDGCRYGEDAFLALKLIFAAPVHLLLEPLVRVDAAASDLNRRRRMRPLEPLFDEAPALIASTSERLRPLLRSVLALRAAKAACVLAYWGRTDEARRLVTRHTRVCDLRHGFVVLARLCASPVGRFASTRIARVQRHMGFA